jgi:hypothetical protein
LNKLFFDQDTNEFVLSSGKRFYAYGGLLSPGRGGLAYGYDGWVDETLTPDEKAEIAQYMIHCWTTWGLSGC